MADLPKDMLPKAEQLLSQQGSGEQQQLYKLPHMLMWTKLRPGIREFLMEAHKLFELHIYTHGDQDYAAEMAKLLDPKKTLFGGRVISGVSLQFLRRLCLSPDVHYIALPLYSWRQAVEHVAGAFNNTWMSHFCQCTVHALFAYVDMCLELFE